MTVPIQQTDHQQAAKDLLPGQFENSTNLRDFIEAIVGPANPVTWTIQELEDVLFAILSDRWLSTAVGVQLDGLGEILGEGRLSADDEEYRDALYTRVIINVSQGEPERLIEVLMRLADPTAVHYIPKPPAGAVLCAIENTQDALLPRLQEVPLGGVHIWVTAGTGGNPFIYGRARDAAGVQFGVQHPHGGLGYGVPGAPGAGGQYVALYVQ